MITASFYNFAQAFVVYEGVRVVLFSSLLSVALIAL
jgi:hypothetical protein